MIAEQLLRELAETGNRLVTDGSVCAIEKAIPDAILPAGLRNRLVKNKDALLALCVCGECGRVTTSLKDMDVLATNWLLCDRRVCPYRQRRG